MCQVITRIFLQRFLAISEHSPPKSIQKLLKDFKKGILKGMKFSFDEFHTLCQYPHQTNESEMIDSMGLSEQKRRELMEKIAKSLIL